MKKFLFILIILLTVTSTNAMTITGGVDYNVSSARQEVMDGIQTQINTNTFSANIFDLQHRENLSYLLNGTTSIKDRTLAAFSDGTYAVNYNNDKLHVYYYEANGNLLYAETKDKTDYPYKSYKYNTQGKLINMGLRVSKGETFIYTPDGKLIAHWLNNNGYDENGKIIMTREYAE